MEELRRKLVELQFEIAKASVIEGNPEAKRLYELAGDLRDLLAKYKQ